MTHKLPASPGRAHGGMQILGCRREPASQAQSQVQNTTTNKIATRASLLETKALLLVALTPEILRKRSKPLKPPERLLLISPSWFA